MKNFLLLKYCTLAESDRRSPLCLRNDFGGLKEIRTPDLFIANEALYQLSYEPTKVIKPNEAFCH